MSVIILPQDLGLVVSKILKEKHNIETKLNKMGLMSFEYTPEELALITDIKLTNPVQGMLRGVELLPNLKSISVTTEAITAHLQDKNIPSISDEDISSIEQCTSLKSLKIVNQAKVSSLDVLKLDKLVTLEITHNQRMDSLSHLENLRNLCELSVYGNNMMFDTPNFGQVILNNQEIAELNLDVLLFPNAIEYNTRTGEYNDKVIMVLKELSDMGSVKWSESLNRNRAIQINNNQMIKLHNRACEILSQNVPESAGVRDSIIGIENYLAQNVQYDYDGMKHGHTNGTEVKIGDKTLRLQNGPKVGTNSAFNALFFEKCVCEGYTRGMQYLLKLKGINSHDVDCYGEADKTGMADGKGETIYTKYQMPHSSEYHSIICIDDYYSLYDDPCWNACRYQSGDKSMPYILRTKEQISKSHTLSFEERNVSNNHLQQPSNVIQASLKRIELFRNARISSINDTKSKVAKQVKGKIVEKEGNVL